MPRASWVITRVSDAEWSALLGQIRFRTRLENQRVYSARYFAANPGRVRRSTRASKNRAYATSADFRARKSAANRAYYAANRERWVGYERTRTPRVRARLSETEWGKIARAARRVR